MPTDIDREVVTFRTTVWINFSLALGTLKTTIVSLMKCSDLHNLNLHPLKFTMAAKLFNFVICIDYDQTQLHQFFINFEH